MSMLYFFFLSFYSFPQVTGEGHGHLIAALFINCINSNVSGGVTQTNIHSLHPSLCFPISHSGLTWGKLLSLKSVLCLIRKEATAWRNGKSLSRNTAGSTVQKEPPFVLLWIQGLLFLCDSKNVPTSSFFFILFYFILFYFILLTIFLMFIFERKTETEKKREQAGKGQREGETHNLKQAPGSELSAHSLMQGLKPQTTRSWLEPKLDAWWTEPPRQPMSVYLLILTWVMIPELWDKACVRLCTPYIPLPSLHVLCLSKKIKIK